MPGMHRIHLKVAAATVVAAIAAALAVVGPLTADTAEGAGTKRVRIVNIDYSPRMLTIARGTTVRWTFEDEDTPHTVTSRGKQRFRSSPSKKSGSYSFRFTKPGQYTYVCTIHFNMKGRVTVR